LFAGKRQQTINGKALTSTNIFILIINNLSYLQFKNTAGLAIFAHRPAYGGMGKKRKPSVFSVPL
jgi:hypothetical protein